jgi:hypothetical protein
MPEKIPRARAPVRSVRDRCADVAERVIRLLGAYHDDYLGDRAAMEGREMATRRRPYEPKRPTD